MAVLVFLAAIIAAADSGPAASEDSGLGLERLVGVKEWRRAGSSDTDGGTLTVSGVRTNGFRFTLDAFSGANVGQIEGIAVSSAARLRFKGENDCFLMFVIQKNGIRVEATPGCSYYGGMGVVFDGDYVPASQATSTPPKTLVERGVLVTPGQERGFAELVGEAYPSFVERFQIVTPGDDLDGVGAKVFKGNVRGLGTLMEAIIMYTPRGQLWAAAVVGDSVRYFTTEPDYMDRLPKTIEQWRERFPEKPVNEENSSADDIGDI